MEKVNIIIMAGGLGKRMNSTLPKVLHKVNNKPMIVRVINTVLELNVNKIFIVVGSFREEIQNTIEQYINSIDNEKIEYILQKEPLGTGHAIQCCYNKLLMYHRYGTFILSGDVPLIKKDTLVNMINIKSNGVVLTANVDNPYGYGRILRVDNKLHEIKEEKDCEDREKKICEINSGIYLISTGMIIENIMYIDNNNSQKEYYLTDIFKLMVDKDVDIELYNLQKELNYQILGVNTLSQLQQLEKLNLEKEITLE